MEGVEVLHEAGCFCVSGGGGLHFRLKHDFGHSADKEAIRGFVIGFS